MSTPEIHDRFRRAAPAGLVVLCSRLRDAGHATYVVGGPVRDLLLDRPIADWDVATSARPEQVAALFERTTLLHAQHGTTQVRLDEARFEVTTFRVDGPYGDGRRPDFVHFTDRLDADLARRDFTVNAMALDPGTLEVIDPHRGRSDLADRRLRTVGDPGTRFREDALRLMRAARFAAVLEFDVDPAVIAAMRREGPGLERIAAERIRDELSKMLAAPRPSRGLRLLQETGLLAQFLPELAATDGVTQNEYHAFDVFTHSLEACDAAPASSPAVRLAALLHDVGKPPTRVAEGERVTFYNHECVGGQLVEARLRALRFPRRTVDAVTHLVRQHMFHYEPEWSDGAVRRFIARVGLEPLDDLFALRVADVAAKGTDEAPPSYIDELRARIASEVAREHAFRIPDLAVTGRDLIDTLGVPEGPDVGRLLRGLLEHVLEDGGANTRETLLARARELRERGRSE